MLVSARSYYDTALQELEQALRAQLRLSHLLDSGLAFNMGTSVQARPRFSGQGRSRVSGPLSTDEGKSWCHIMILNENFVPI